MKKILIAFTFLMGLNTALFAQESKEEIKVLTYDEVKSDLQTGVVSFVNAVKEI